MALIYNYSSKKWEDTPDVEAQSKLAAGTHGMESGIDIPVINPDGQFGTIKSDDAAKAFKEGFRLSNPEDIKRQAEVQNQQQIKDHYDSAAMGASLGAMSGATMGLSDAAFNQMGLGGEVQKYKEINPTSSMVGEITGSLANPLVLGGARALGNVAKLGTTGLVGNIARQAGEGAFFGLGHGISEAALGDPNDVAENLLSNIGLGGVFGAAGGAAIEGASALSKPLFNFSAKVTGKLDDIVQNAARKVAKGTMIPSLSPSEMREAAGLSQDLVDNPDFRAAAFKNGGLDKFKSAIKDSDVAAKEVEDRVLQTRKELKNYLQAEPRVVQDDVNKLVNDARGNLHEAMDTSYSNYKELDKSFRNTLSQMSHDPAEVGDEVYAMTNNHIDGLLTSSDPAARAKASEYRQILDSYLPRTKLLDEARKQIVIPDGMTKYKAESLLDSYVKDNLDTLVPKVLSKEDEVFLARRLRSATPVKESGIGNFAEDVRSKFINYRKDIDALALKGHPDEFISTNQNELDRYYTAYKGMENFVTTNQGQNLNKASSLLNKMLLPEKSAQFSDLLNNLAEFTPEIRGSQQLLEAGASKAKQLDQFKIDLNKKLAEKGFTNLNADDFNQLAGSLNSGSSRGENLAMKLAGQTELSQQVAGMANPIDKLMFIKKAAGQDVSKELEALAGFHKDFDKLIQIQGAEKEAAANRPAIGNLLSALGIGGTLMSGNPAYFAGGLALKLSGGINPLKTLKVLTQIEQASAKSAQILDKTIKSTIGILTKDESAKAAARAFQIKKPETQKERRANFVTISNNLSKLSTPYNVDQHAKSTLGEIPEAPMVYGSLVGKLNAASMFLQSKLPSDPLAGKYMFATKSQWAPTDTQLAQFSRYQQAVEQPLGVINHVGQGTVTPEEIEGLKAVYPNIYNKLQKSIVNAIIDHGEDIPYQQRLKLGQLFQIPSDPSLDPQFIATMQSNYTGEPAQAQQGPGRPAKSNLNIDSSKLLTETQKVSNGA